MAMVSGGGHYNGPKEVKYLFIDGAYLRRVAEDASRIYFNNEPVPIDFNALAQGFTKAFYYDCPFPKNKNETKKEYENRKKIQQGQFNEMRMLKGFHVFEGTIKGNEKKSRQKQVDVKIAVDMLTHSYRRNMHQATLLAGDLDFKPIVDALVQDGMYVELWYYPKSTSKELIYSADSRLILTLGAIHRYAMPSFKAKFSWPETTIKDKDVVSFKFLKKGKGPDNEIVELYKDNERYYYISPNSQNPGKYNHTYCQNLDILEKYFENEFYKVQWDE